MIMTISSNQTLSVLYREMFLTLYQHYTQYSVRFFFPTSSVPCLSILRTDKLQTTKPHTTHTYTSSPPHRTGIPTPENAKNHTPGFAQAARTEAAHVAAIRTATLLARTAFRVHADGAFCARVRAAYEAGATGASSTAASAPAVGTTTGASASRNSAPPPR